MTRRASLRNIHGPLFDPPPAARKTDPDTSHRAEWEHTASGARSTHLRMILEKIRVAPGLTCRELAYELPLDAYEISKRLSDLSGAEQIAVNGTRRCRFSNRPARTWRAVS